MLAGEHCQSSARVGRYVCEYIKPQTQFAKRGDSALLLRCLIDSNGLHSVRDPEIYRQALF